MKLYLDDVRTPPAEDEWIVIRQPALFLAVLDACAEDVTNVSLDHDLGIGHMTGVDVMNHIEAANEGMLPHYLLTVHSSNPPGRAAMQATIRRMVERSAAGHVD